MLNPFFAQASEHDVLTAVNCTFWTDEYGSLTRWFVPVNILFVSAQVIHSTERFVADVTGVRFYSVVVPHVKLHRVPAAVSVRTFWTNVPPVKRSTKLKQTF